MSASSAQGISSLYRYLFQVHDVVSDFLARHIVVLKRTLLLCAHISLLGIFVPEWQREYGNFAGNLLIIILFLSPLSKMTRMPLLLQLMGFRRELGILMGYAALVHGLGYMIAAQTLVLPVLPKEPTFADVFLFFGSTGFFLIIPLLITSNVFSLKILGKYWKRLHFLAYPAFVIIVSHRLLAKFSFEPIQSVVEATILLGTYVAAKAFVKKPFFPPLSRILLRVAEQYRAFQKEKNLIPKI